MTGGPSPISVSSESPHRMASSIEGIQLCTSECIVCNVLWSLLELPDRTSFQSTAFFIHSVVRWYTASKPSVVQSAPASEQAESEALTSDHSIAPSVHGTALDSEDDTVYSTLPRRAG